MSQGPSKQITSVVYCNALREVVTGVEGGWLCVWNTFTGRLAYVWKGHTHAVSQLIFVNATRTLISVSLDGKVKFWSFPARQRVDGGAEKGRTAADDNNQTNRYNQHEEQRTDRREAEGKDEAAAAQPSFSFPVLPSLRVVLWLAVSPCLPLNPHSPPHRRQTRRQSSTTLPPAAASLSAPSSPPPLPPLSTSRLRRLPLLPALLTICSLTRCCPSAAQSPTPRSTWTWSRTSSEDRRRRADRGRGAETRGAVARQTHALGSRDVDTGRLTAHDELSRSLLVVSGARHSRDHAAASRFAKSLPPSQRGPITGIAMSA